MAPAADETMGTTVSLENDVIPIMSSPRNTLNTPMILNTDQACSKYGRLGVASKVALTVLGIPTEFGNGTGDELDMFTAIVGSALHDIPPGRLGLA